MSGAGRWAPLILCLLQAAPGKGRARGARGSLGPGLPERRGPSGGQRTLPPAAGLPRPSPELPRGRNSLPGTGTRGSSFLTPVVRCQVAVEKARIALIDKVLFKVSQSAVSAQDPHG
jgi:hypothetical protein